jgi:hypothetical protein
MVNGKTRFFSILLKESARVFVHIVAIDQLVHFPWRGQHGCGRFLSCALNSSPKAPCLE